MKKLYLALPLVLLLSGCALLNPNNKKTSTDTSQSGNESSGDNSSQSSSGSSSSSSSSSQGGQGNTKVFSFDFTSSTYSNGTAVKDRYTELIAYMNGESDIVSSLEAVNCTFRKFHQDNTPTTIQIGSGPSSSGGSFTINFNYVITKIAFTLQGYSTYYSSEWHPDTNAELDVAGHHYNLGGTDTTNELPLVNDEITLEGNVKTITFSNDEGGHRGFLHSLTIEYTPS